MAQRRMFSPDIVSSEEFLSMPVSSRELYFQLGMHADDDGFIQPKLIMKLTGAVEDDLKVLLAKRFLLPFQSGVVVIKHWLIHNMIRADRYKPTRFQDEKKTLFIKENRAYTDNKLLGCQNDNQPATQVRLGKVRLSKDKEEKNDIILEEKEYTSAREFLTHYFSEYKRLIGDNLPIYSERIILPKIEYASDLFGGYEKLKGLLKVYFNEDGRFYKENKWSLTCFLSENILNKLNE